MSKNIFIPFFLILFSTIYNVLFSKNIVRVYDVPSAMQGVAVDSAFFYVINNTSIAKYLKTDGSPVTTWYDEDSLIHHLNSGIIIDGKLFFINSNNPEIPMASSVEIFDPATLEHVGTHSFGIMNGSATWIDRYNNFWYVAFAHYTGKGGNKDKSNAWTLLAKFDLEWRQVESWVFPKGLLKKFGDRSNSGGVILPTGQILCTGHDNFEVYIFEFPDKGPTLKWIGTIPVGSFGQGIAYEKVGESEFIYGILKNENKVIVTKIK